MRSRATSLAQRLLRDEAASGKFLLAATAVALIFANSPLASMYDQFWLQHISLGFGEWQFSESYRDFINEGLMALFFLVAGLEIKREIVRGELRNLRVASLPIAAAVGGMVVPAVIYLVINWGHGGLPGWGIPMATDIAFAVGVLALMSRRVPVSLKIFLLTLAVVDDIGAIMVISIFYSQPLQGLWLMAAGGIIGLVFILRRFYVLRLRWFLALGVLLWIAISGAGIHASITGAILGLIAPMTIRVRSAAKLPMAERLERSLIPLTTFMIIPLFALANAGVALSGNTFSSDETMRIGAGVMFGLVIGKVVGIVATSWLVVRCNLASLPEGVGWRHITGVGFIGGIGFTLSLFMAEIALHDEAYLAAAKVSILAASILSGLLGLAVLQYAHIKQRR